jgi:hypothetical protein
VNDYCPQHHCKNFFFVKEHHAQHYFKNSPTVKEHHAQHLIKKSPPLEGCQAQPDGVVLYACTTKRYKSLPCNPALRDFAKALRKAGMFHEVLLWKELKTNKLNGLDFDRQKIIGNYIVDFYCAEKAVVIEVDGSSHNDKKLKFC